ncbi:MAG TPA: PDZ domain-containing protein [Syntrophales bacterium]|nr:PDZ domain-containing protein [Syntrophales bacterium]
MVIRRLPTIYILLALWPAFFCFEGLGTARAASLQLDIRNSLIVLKAKQTPIIDILKAVADRTGFTFETTDPLTEPVSVDIEALTLEECVRHLLANRNYSIIFEKNKKDIFVLKSLYIIGAGATTRVQPRPGLSRQQSDLPVDMPPQHDPVRKFEKDWLAKEFDDYKKLEKEIVTESKQEDPMGVGIRINKISRNSPLRKIGLTEGDVIHDINGKSVQTTGEFIEALQSAFRSQEMIRIELTQKNDRVEPIYIKVQ